MRASWRRMMPTEIRPPSPDPLGHGKTTITATRRLLLVDDDQDIRSLLQLQMEGHGFVVVPASNVSDALSLIVSQKFDVLITDLHMPGPGDGFTVVTAMRHFQPQAITMVLSGFPDIKEAMSAIELEADNIVAKPFMGNDIANLIDKRLHEARRPPGLPKESIATILEHDAPITIERWLARVADVEELARVPLGNDARTEYLTSMLQDIVSRLRRVRVVEAIASPSSAAVAHGQLRCRQGYTAPMIVQESRILQVCIFETIQRNLPTVDFSLVLPDIMLIADEVDSQLTQSIESYLIANQHSLDTPTADKTRIDSAEVRD